MHLSSAAFGSDFDDSRSVASSSGFPLQVSDYVHAVTKLVRMMLMVLVTSVDEPCWGIRFSQYGNTMTVICITTGNT